MSGSAPSEEPGELAELAHTYGVATEYENWRGQTVTVSTDTLVAVLGALGVDAASPPAVRAALHAARLAPWRRQLPPVTVTRAGEPATIPVRGPEGQSVQGWVELEDGGVRHDLGRLARSAAPVTVEELTVGETTLQAPADLPLGWHRIHIRCGESQAAAPLVVTPAFLSLPEHRSASGAADREVSGQVQQPRDQAKRPRTWGLMAQLYSVRSRSSWGTGDLRDLAELAALAGSELGAGWVLVNPLHAGQPVTPVQPSPYFPASRRFADPLYLRVEDIPEFTRLADAERDRVRQLAAPLRERNHTADLLDRDAVWAAKRAALELVFAVPRGPEREAAYAAFRAREGYGEGGPLRDFATWCALVERHGLPWQEWPAELQDPRSAAVARAREELAHRVEFYCWLQWQLDEQLASAQRAASNAGMPVGLVHDLAVGASPGGADAWMLGHTLARGVTAGAPPDQFNQQGQDWGLPPWRPDQLAEAGYKPYQAMLRSALRHGGGLRVDHILGMFRMWWVPDGMPPWAGTYVRYDHYALIGILTLEAWRAGAVVIGEDLGTVEPGVRDYLSERGILGTSLLWFETEDEGRPRHPERWRELCLASVGTHDMPPIAGYLAGEHLELRERLGLLGRPVELERAEHAAERRAWVRTLQARGLLDEREDPDRWAIVRALHAFLTRTPARLIGVALTDAVGEHRTQNQPGTTSEYPNWRIPLADGAGRPVLLEDLHTDTDTAAAAGLRELARIVRADPWC